MNTPLIVNNKNSLYLNTLKLVKKNTLNIYKYTEESKT